MIPKVSGKHIYLVSSLIGYGIPFLQNLLFAFLLDKENYGQLVVFWSLFGLLTAVFGFGVGQTIQRYFYEWKYVLLIKRLLGFWFLASLVFSFLMVLGAILYYFFFDSFLRIQLFFVVLISSALFSVTNTFPQVFVIQKQPLRYGLHLVFSRLSLLIMSIIVYLISGFDIEKYVWGYFVAALWTYMYVAYDLRFFKGLLFKKESIKEIFLFSYPLMINTVGSIGYSHGFKLILSLLTTKSNIGIFNIASTLASSFYLVSTSLLKIYIPDVYESLKSSNGDTKSTSFYRKKIVKIALIYGFAFIFLIPAFLFLYKNGEYLEAAKISLILLLAYAVLLLYGEYNIIALFLKKTRFITMAVLSGVFMSVIALVLLLNSSSSPIFIGIAILLGYLVQYSILRRLTTSKNG